MMRRKVEHTVRLVVPAHGLVGEFGIAHAERLLDMGPALNGGWELPDDSDYYYDIENGLRAKSNKGDSSASKEA